MPCTRPCSNPKPGRPGGEQKCGIRTRAPSAALAQVRAEGELAALRRALTQGGRPVVSSSSVASHGTGKATCRLLQCVRGLAGVAQQDALVEETARTDAQLDLGG